MSPRSHASPGDACSHAHKDLSHLSGIMGMRACAAPARPRAHGPPAARLRGYNRYCGGAFGTGLESE
eukprot:75933-Prymnesium_polylepis.2